MGNISHERREMEAAALCAVELARRKKQHALEYLEPYIGRVTGKSWQREFSESTAKDRAVIGANRIGKTKYLGGETAYHLTGWYPKGYPEEGKSPIPNRGRIIVKSFEKHFDTSILPYLNEFIPERLIRNRRKNSAGHYTQWALTNGSTFDVVSHEQDPFAFESWSGHWAWFDEPMPRWIWIATKRGLLDFSGRSWMGLTLLEEPWLEEEIFNAALTNPNIQCWMPHMWDNPYMKEEDIKEYEKFLTEEEKETRIWGHFKLAAQYIYAGFDKSVHVIHIDRDQIPDSWMKLAAIDHGSAAPTAVPYVAYTNDGDFVIYDEYYVPGKTVAEHAPEIWEKGGGTKISQWLADPALWQKTQQHGTLMCSIADKYRDYQRFARLDGDQMAGIKIDPAFTGIPIIKGNNDFKAGSDAIKRLLLVNPDKINPFTGKKGAPRLYVCDRCVNTIKEFQSYKYAKNHDGTYTDKPKPNQADHILDVLREIVLAQPELIIELNNWKPPIEIESELGSAGW